MAAARKDVEAILNREGGGGDSASWRRWAYGGGAIAVVLLGYWLLSGDSAAKRYVTEPATTSTLVVTVTATGTVEPTNQVEISSELSGTIAAVEVDENHTVQQGEPLARLDVSKLEAEVDQARATLATRNAQIAEAEATVVELKLAHERSDKLLQRGAASLEENITAKAQYDRAVAALAGAKADADVAAATLRIAETDLEKSCICSPITGMVLSRDVEPGQIVASSLQAPTLFTIAEDLRQMELRVDIDEADVGKVKVGDKASFTVEAYQNRSFPAEIAEIGFSPTTVDGVVTYEAVLTIDNGELLLRPGMTATADIIVAEIEDTLTVSNAALRFTPPETASEETEGGGRSGLIGLLMPRPRGGEASKSGGVAADGGRVVWRLEDGAPVAVAIHVGESDGRLTQVVEGPLAEGDRLITDMLTE